MCHFIAGVPMPQAAVAENACGFEVFYAKLGVATLSSVVDGDCGLDVMSMMLGRPTSAASRAALRVELSDYLMSRITEPWMHTIMASCQELNTKDVELSSVDSQCTRVLVAPPSAVADPADVADPGAEEQITTPDAETFAAVRWASCLGDDSNVLNLIRSLPRTVVEEQVRLYRQHDATAALVVPDKATQKIRVPLHPRCRDRVLVAQRFHKYCQSRGILPDKRMPYGAMASFIKDHIEWKAKQAQPTSKLIREWYSKWCATSSSVMVAAAVADKPCPGIAEKSLLRSRAPQLTSERHRAHGAGRPYTQPLVRQALYEWWSSIRYAIDWKTMATSRRSRGKKILARFPRSVLILKVRQLLEELAYASLLNGVPMQSFEPDSWWFKRWEDEYGLSMRVANRKYQVPRHVLKERLEIFWTNLFRLRKFIILVFGYDPLIINWDQSPFHHNETGSQNKLTLSVRGGIVPVVEGNSDAKSRWTANLSTVSDFAAVADGMMPFCECMFKAEIDGAVNERLQSFLRSHGFPRWFTVTVGPKGSYREHDIISFLQKKHLEPWKEGRDWRILLADDYSAHKTDNVWSLCWSRGYIILIHGGGSTPVGQTVDTDLNEHTRRRYGNMESRLLIEKMRAGDVVPKLTHEECMLLMYDVLSDPQLHKDASKGYKKVGQSVDIDGQEDALICREAGQFWNEETTDSYPSMRPKIDAELAVVADEVSSGGLTFTQHDVRRLITPYPPRRAVDRVLAKLGEDFYHDDVHELENGCDGAAVADVSQDAPDDSSDGGISEDAAVRVGAAVAGDACADHDELEADCVPLSADQAEAVHQVQTSIAGYQATIENLSAMGSVRGVQLMESELKREKRKERQLIAATPAVADSFLRLRAAERDADLRRKHAAAQQTTRKREAAKALSDRDAAVAELKKTRKALHDFENLSACTHAIKTFTLDCLGADSHNAGGAKSRKNRFEVLDRLARMNAGLSAGQKNDWTWFKEAWDQRMVIEYESTWALQFSQWVQAVLDDKRSNAFSMFVYNETRRVFEGSSALHVP